jgi:hypothetical protein
MFKRSVILTLLILSFSVVAEANFSGWNFSNRFFYERQTKKIIIVPVIWGDFFFDVTVFNLL